MIGEKISDQDIATLFYFPLFADKYEEEAQAVFEFSFGLLISAIQDLKAFYNKYEFFYNQYKHGLCVVSRAYKDYDSDQIARDKSNWQDRHLNVFDNLSVTKLAPKSVRISKKVFMPYLTSEIQENLVELMKDDNLIRFVSQDSRITIAELVLIVRKSYTCASVFMRNIINTLNGEFPMNLYLPHSWEGDWIKIPFTEDLYKLATNKQIFI